MFLYLQHFPDVAWKKYKVWSKQLRRRHVEQKASAIVEIKNIKSKLNIGPSLSQQKTEKNQTWEEIWENVKPENNKTNTNKFPAMNQYASEEPFIG